MTALERKEAFKEMLKSEKGLKDGTLKRYVSALGNSNILKEFGWKEIYEYSKMTQDFLISKNLLEKRWKNIKEQKDEKQRSKYSNFYNALNHYCEFMGGASVVSKNSHSNANSDKNSNNTDISYSFPKNENAENRIFYGVPGSGKSHLIEEKIREIVKKDGNPLSDDEYKDFEKTNTMRLVFHPDYSYSDFVGQILPRASNGNIAYDFVEGPFTCILEKAQNNKDNPFFLIIEEINRGNAAAIFGDIFQLLDRYDDGIGKYSIKNADIAEKIFKDKNIEIRLPKNLWIFATMNTSDQNVFTLDTAFQRRFEMQLVENKFSDDPNKQGFEIEDTGVTWKIFAEAINDILAKQDAVVSSEDKSLGAWFVKPDKGSNAISKEKFANKVLKYLWDDAFKFARNEIFKVSEDKNTLQKVILAFKLGGFDGIFQDSIIQKIKLENN